MPRRQRQQAEILRIAGSGDLRRALALSREHLAEFPDDRHVLVAISDDISASGDQTLEAELRDLVGTGHT